MAKIVVVDAQTLNPGDLSWAPLHALGQCEVHDRTASAEELLERTRDAELVLTNKSRFDAAILAQLPQLRYIGVTATGFNIIDTTAAASQGITVCNAPSYGSASVAQMTFAHVLNLANGVAHHAAEVRRGRWAESDQWCFWDQPLLELHGRTIGIVGLGEIGRATAALARAFGMQVIAATRTPRNLPGVRETSLETLAREADVVSLHCPLTPDTESLVDEEFLRWMKPTALLINTSRGQLVDSQALAKALREGRIFGAGIDTLDQEPPPPGHPLAAAPNCFVTPHIAWATQAARQRLQQISIDNVREFLAGRPQNVVASPVDSPT